MDVSTILGGNRSGGRAHPFLEGGKFHHKGGVFGPPFLVELHTIYRNSVICVQDARYIIIEVMVYRRDCMTELFFSVLYCALVVNTHVGNLHARVDG